jgi:protein SCO1/2
MMRRFRDTQQVRDENWQFLSSNADTMQRLSRQLGFFYQPSSGGFDHQIQASLISPEGKVTRQIYGMDFAPPLLVEPLKRLIFSLDDNPGFFGSISNQIRLYSIVYDPYKNIYYFDYSIFIKFSMGLSYMSVIGIFLFREWRKTNRSRKRSE